MITVNVVTAQACQRNCLLTDEERACESQIVKVLQCIRNVQGLCTDQAPQDACEDEIDAVGECEEPTGGPATPGPGACANATSLCDLCRCALPDGQDESMCDPVCM